MLGQYRMEPVTMLIADGTEGVRNAVKLYAECQHAVELCAAVSTGNELLELLNQGLHPSVLVLDALLQKPNIFHLLNEIRMLSPRYDPVILVTTVTEMSGSLSKLLTSGADYTILKPYGLNELFDTVVQCGSDESNLAVYRVREHLNKIITALGVSHRMYGLAYLENIISCMVLSGENCTVDELYQKVADEENVSRGAVTSAVRRIAAAMCARSTAAYGELCEANGKKPGEHLTNTEMLRGIANRIRSAMRL